MVKRWALFFCRLKSDLELQMSRPSTLPPYLHLTPLVLFVLKYLNLTLDTVKRLQLPDPQDVFGPEKQDPIRVCDRVQPLFDFLIRPLPLPRRPVDTEYGWSPRSSTRGVHTGWFTDDGVKVEGFEGS